MEKGQSFNFLNKTRILNRGKITMKSMLNINCFKNNAKKLKNPPNKYICINWLNKVKQVYIFL